MTAAYKNLLIALKSGKLESKKQQDHAFKILNGSNEELKQQIKYLLNDQTMALSELQNKQGFEWLMALWKTPKGKEKDKNPFGYREQDVLDTFRDIELVGYYDAGSYGRSYYVPLYDCNAVDGGGFQYYVWHGVVHIIG